MNIALAASLSRGFIAANGLRIALTLSCIALGVALAGAVHTVHSSALAEVDRAARTLAGTADLEVRGARSGFDDAIFARVASLPGVAEASPVLEVRAALPGRDDTLRILGIDALRAVRMQPAFVPGAASTGAGEVSLLLDEKSAWLSPAAATRLGLGKGQALRLVAGTGVREYEVAGVLAGLAQAGEVAVLDIAVAQWHFGRVGNLSRIELRLRPGVHPDTVSAELARFLPAGVGVSAAASSGERAQAISRAYRVNLDALALVALATGAFLVFSTLALQAARRRQEFALLRALGATRRGVAALVLLEGAVIGALGAALGTALGIAASRTLLQRSGGDLGAGFFEGLGATFTPDPAGLAAIALLGAGVAVAGALWVARGVAGIAVADALRDRAIDLPFGARRHAAVAIALAALGVPLLFVPPLGGLPLGGYAAIGAWLVAAVAAVTPVCRALLGRLSPEGAIASLGVAQVRHLPGHLAASVAGIVVSASLCIAMAIMVHSFRASLSAWLDGVVGADLYVRAAPAGDTAYFSEEEQRRIASAQGVESVEPLAYDRLVVGDGRVPLSLVARPVTTRLLEGFQAEPPGIPPPSSAPAVWISEAARDLHGWKPGDRIPLPVAGRLVDARVAGVIRDYARTWGAVMMDWADYRRLAGEGRANDLALRLAPGAQTLAVQAAIRAAMPSAAGLVMEDATHLRRRSLEIFDRSFAVTYALEAIAIAIGLAGVTSSFAALAWSRRREFGVLRFLGLTRREILRLLAIEGAATGALGGLIGVAAGAGISLVLVHVVNRQSFHWGMEVHWPLGTLLLLFLAIVATCAVGAPVSGALAVRREAVLAVKDDA
ncbi:MAG TPA: FtsX-like permease family protein [Usitatibacter sp.]|nr:FtsX-like permease family protein [Usitatibacter sp.]